jgi:predicted outer membrane repeat protein
MGNIWFETNKKRIENIKRQLIEYNYAGSYGGAINLMEVNNIIDGLLIELTKLDKENASLRLYLKQANSTDNVEGDSNEG